MRLSTPAKITVTVKSNPKVGLYSPNSSFQATFAVFCGFAECSIYPLFNFIIGVKQALEQTMNI